MILTCLYGAWCLRLLGLKEGSKLGFWRNLVGQGEKWQVLKASANQVTNAAGGSSGGTAAHLSRISRGCEDLSSRGMYMRLGDAILLQTYKSDHLLSLYEALGGPEARLVYRDRAGLGCEAWQVEQFGSVGLPAWYHSRPYLRYITVLSIPYIVLVVSNILYLFW